MLGPVGFVFGAVGGYMLGDKVFQSAEESDESGDEGGMATGVAEGSGESGKEDTHAAVVMNGGDGGGGGLTNSLWGGTSGEKAVEKEEEKKARKEEKGSTQAELALALEEAQKQLRQEQIKNRNLRGSRAPADLQADADAVAAELAAAELAADADDDAEDGGTLPASPVSPANTEREVRALSAEPGVVSVLSTHMGGILQPVKSKANGAMVMEIYENQRWVPGGGWSDKFLGIGDPKAFTGGGVSATKPRTGSVHFGDLEPLLPTDFVWTTHWNVDLDYTECDDGGFGFYLLRAALFQCHVQPTIPSNHTHYPSDSHRLSPAFTISHPTPPSTHVDAEQTVGRTRSPSHASWCTFRESARTAAPRPLTAYGGDAGYARHARPRH